MMHYNVREWTAYVVPHVMALYFSKMKPGILKIEGKSIEQRKSRNLLKRCSIEYDALIPYNENSDYCKFRARPLIRLSRSEFAITNVVFFIEHLYNSLYFDLKQFRKDSGFRSDDEFRTYWTTEFSQKFMFYGFIRNCLNGDEDSVLDGDECDRIIKARGLKGANPPDFYIRTSECCLLFEYKDALLSGDAKDKRNIKSLRSSIERRFFRSAKGKAKGVTQLLLNAEAIQSGTFAFDDVPASISIIPVLVVDNPSYTMVGMRTELEYKMREMCVEYKLNSEQIRPLILIDVASFKLYENYFRQNGFCKVFSDYYRNSCVCPGKEIDVTMMSMCSFSDYIMRERRPDCIPNVVRRLMKNVRRFNRMSLAKG